MLHQKKCNILVLCCMGSIIISADHMTAKDKILGSGGVLQQQDSWGVYKVRDKFQKGGGEDEEFSTCLVCQE